MIRARLLLGMFVAAVLIAGSLYGQDTKGKGKLPSGWGKLGLSDDQKQQVFQIRAKYGPQIQELKTKLADLEKQEQADLFKVLTKEQKDRLREAALKKAPPADSDTKKEK